MAWSVSTQNKANPAMSLVTCVGNMLGCLLHNSNFYTGRHRLLVVFYKASLV